MKWLLLIIGVVAFFYVVGRLTSKSEKTSPSVSMETRDFIPPANQNKRLPWGDDLYQHTHLFTLFGTEAALAWNDGDDMVYVWCISRFSKGEPTTKVYARYYYGINDKVWHSPPPGAARECLKEIKTALRLK